MKTSIESDGVRGGLVVRAFLFFVALTAWVGCPGPEATINLVVTANADVVGITELEVAITGASGLERMTFSPDGAELVFPYQTSLATNLSGTVEVFVHGLVLDVQIASGSTAANLGSVTEVTVNLAIGGASTFCGNCSVLASPAACVLGVCDLELGNCMAAIAPDGVACDDASSCTLGDVCAAGACQPGPVMDCSALDDVCNMGTCDELAGCVLLPRPDGSACDDGDDCTDGEACVAGSCTGANAVDCSALSDPPCAIGVCQNGVGCVAMTMPDGTACSDSLSCTVGDACGTGACVPGPVMDCTALDDACNVGMCDEIAGCIAVPVMDGTLCVDADVCNGDETCQVGVCTPGPVLNCDDMNTCTTDTCDAIMGCANTVLPDATPCEDGLFCTTNDDCAAGICVGGAAPDCSSFDDQCNFGMCAEPMGGCYPDPVLDGTGCDDGDPVCTPTPDSCQAGTCTGTSICCSNADIALSEVFGGSPDWIEVINTGTCDWDIGGLTIQWNLCDTNSYTFAAGTIVPAGTVYRLVESSSCMGANEVCFGSNICDNPTTGGWVALCDGLCDTMICGNFLDYVEKGSPSGAPACASFSPAPVSLTGVSSSESVTRIAFVGGGAAGLQSDWAIAPISRD